MRAFHLPPPARICCVTRLKSCGAARRGGGGAEGDCAQIPRPVVLGRPGFHLSIPFDVCLRPPGGRDGAQRPAPHFAPHAAGTSAQPTAHAPDPVFLYSNLTALTRRPLFKSGPFNS
eukprot:9167833-Pyramimonas_sp.AAC.1